MLIKELDLPCEPLELAARAEGLPGLCLLLSGMQAYGLGRYSILAANPFKTFTHRNGVAEIVRDGAIERREGSLFAELKQELDTRREAQSWDLPYISGPIGYVAYEAGRHIEPSALTCGSRDGYDARFNFYSGAILFDHLTGKVFLTSARSEIEAELQVLVDAVSRGVNVGESSFQLLGSLRANFERDEYLKTVECIRERIRDGEVYQVNLSQRFEAPCAGSSFELFRRLAVASPAPYAAYLKFDDEAIVSSSPERFLKSKNNAITTRPIKGTRPTGANPEETEANASALRDSEKDRSELLMIVDLERNDLGKVCRPGSVSVERLFELERYASVIHQTADVSGELEEGRGAFDGFQALFPGGSITGAPKIRAMQIIEELERGERGVYTGAIGYFDLSGDCEFSIAIRTIRVANGNVSFQVGGGIVWDSDPDSEYEETLVKARAMIEAIGGKHE